MKDSSSDRCRILSEVKQILRQVPAQGWQDVTGLPGTDRFSFLPRRYNTENVMIVVRIADDFYLAKSTAETGSGVSRLRQEIAWYEDAFRKGLNVINHCPEYIGSLSDQHRLLLVVRFIPNAITLRQAILNNRLNIDEAVSIIKIIFALLAFEIRSYGPLEQQQLRKGFRERLYARAGLIRNAVSVNPLGLNCWDEGIVVNGLPATTLLELFEWLDQHSHDLEYPLTAVCGIAHGDLHLENILLRDNRSFILVDPNYEYSALPIYDLGKLAQSILGLYDLIHDGQFTLECVAPRELQLRFGKDGLSVFGELNDRLTLLLNFFTNDELLKANLLRQMQVMCLAHFFCLLPHHTPDGTKLLALIARTLTLFHDIKAQN